MSGRAGPEHPMTSSAALDALHEDADLLVVNKPAGLVCHPSKDGEASSLVGRVRLHLGSTEGRLVNRLDRETSGVVLVAKGANVARELGSVLTARGVAKVYDSVVHGHLLGDDVEGQGWRHITAALGSDDASPVAIKDCARPDGAPAETLVRLVRHVERDGRPYSLVEVRPITGRKHQIRIHLAHIGHPIVGDPTYGGIRRHLPADLRALGRLERPFLHALRLAFAHPADGRMLEFTAPLAPDLQRVLDEIRLTAGD